MPPVRGPADSEDSKQKENRGNDEREPEPRGAPLRGSRDGASSGKRREIVLLPNSSGGGLPGESNVPEPRGAPDASSGIRFEQELQGRTHKPHGTNNPKEAHNGERPDSAELDSALAHTHTNQNVNNLTPVGPGSGNPSVTAQVLTTTLPEVAAPDPVFRQGAAPAVLDHGIYPGRVGSGAGEKSGAHEHNIHPPEESRRDDEQSKFKYLFCLDSSPIAPASHTAPTREHPEASERDDEQRKVKYSSCPEASTAADTNESQAILTRVGYRDIGLAGEATHVRGSHT